METKTSNDPYRSHKATCPECQKGTPCQVAHNLLLTLADFKPKGKQDEKSILRNLPYEAEDVQESSAKVCKYC